MENLDRNYANELTSFVTFRLAHVQNRLNAQASKILRDAAGITLVEWRILILLKSMGGSSLTDLAETTTIDKGQLSRNINAMITKDLIHAQANPEDQRKQILHLTASALDLSDRLFPLMRQRQEHLLHKVEPNELEIFFKVLDQIDAAAEKKDFL